MSFQDASGNGVVVGDTSLRMLYGGSGKTWRRADQVQYPPLPRYRRQTVYDAFYTAPSTDLATTAYACGHGDAAVNEPTIYLRSDDGGFTWQYLPQDDPDKTYGDAVALHFVDPTHGVAIGVSGGRSFVSRTEDGEHFVPVYSIDTSRTRLRGIGGSGTELWMIGSNCYLAHSSDFGTTWKRTLLCGPVGVERTGDPVSFSLEQNFPNPFPSGSTTLIRFSPGDGIGGNPAPLLLELYDALGRKLRTIASGEYAPGEYSIAFASGDLPAGMYYYRLTAAGATRTRAMMILRSSR
jgi:hypothetical protein